MELDENEPLELLPRGSHFELVSDFLAWTTYVLALFPITYGFLLLIFGESAWGVDPSSGRVSDVYEVALGLPGAPESWAIIALVTGVVLFWAQWTHRMRTMTVTCSILSVWFFFFAGTFVSAWIENDWYEPSLLPAVAYGTLALLSTGRARMAWGWRDVF